MVVGGGDERSEFNINLGVRVSGLGEVSSMFKRWREGQTSDSALANWAREKTHVEQEM